MAKVFYDHLIKIQEIEEELGKYELDVVEKEEILRLADEQIHIRVLDVILRHLPKDKHNDFLIKFHQAPHEEKLLEYLSIEADKDIAAKIETEAKWARDEILSEVRRSTKK